MFPTGSLFSQGTTIHNGHDGKRFLKLAGCSPFCTEILENFGKVWGFGRYQNPVDDQHSKIIHLHTKLTEIMASTM